MKEIFQKYYPEITGIIVFITYLFTIGHSVGENDSGELAMAQATLSIPHPTGYPLFVLIGYLFSKIPLPFAIIFKLNLLCAIWCTLTVIIVIRISSLLLENFSFVLTEKGRSITGILKVDKSKKIIISTYSGLMLAYSATFWLQSTKVEVYALQIFLTSLILFLTIRAFLYDRIKQGGESHNKIFKRWWLVFLLIGFGFANHMMTLYLLPSTIIIFFFSSGLNKKSVKSILLLFILTAGVSIIFYLGLMFRAKMNPLWSYGDPSTITSLYEHVTAKEYSKYMLQGFDSAKEQGTILLKMLSFNFSTDYFSAGEFSFSLFFGIAGLLLLFLFKREIAWYFVLILIVSVSLAFSYKIPDINEYFLVPFTIISILSIIPVIFIIQILKHKKLYLILFTSILAFLILTEFVFNFNYTNRSNAFIFEDFYKTSIKKLPANSILLTDKWSIFMSPGLYYRDVENLRKDITFVSPYAMIFNDWYRRSQKIKTLDSNYTIIKQKNLFVGFDVVLRPLNTGMISLPTNSVLVPYLYYYRLVFDHSYYPMEDDEFEIRFNKKPYNDYDAYIYSLIPFMLEQRILYELNFHKVDKASSCYKKIRTLFKNHEISDITILALNSAGIVIN